jgi:hypothetical protein
LLRNQRVSFGEARKGTSGRRKKRGEGNPQREGCFSPLGYPSPPFYCSATKGFPSEKQDREEAEEAREAGREVNTKNQNLKVKTKRQKKEEVFRF